VPFAPKVRPSLRQEIADELRLAIFNGVFNSGDRIYEGRIAEQMGVSRVPVREALTLLEQEGLVVRRPNRGVFVSKLSYPELSEFYSLRSVVEEFAMELAMNNAGEDDIARMREQLRKLEDAFTARDKIATFEADIAFHRAIVEASKHNLLIRFWDQIAAMLRAQFITLLPVLYPMREDLVGRHKALLEAMLGDDVECARVLIRDHVIASGESLAQEAKHHGVIGGGDEKVTTTV
jgi:DNA-binding GntR family transcriptional regulator